MLSKTSQPHKDKYCMFFSHMGNLDGQRQHESRRDTIREVDGVKVKEGKS